MKNETNFKGTSAGLSAPTMEWRAAVTKWPKELQHTIHVTTRLHEPASDTVAVMKWHVQVVADDVAQQQGVAVEPQRVQRCCGTSKAVLVPVLTTVVFTVVLLGLVLLLA